MKKNWKEILKLWLGALLLLAESAAIGCKKLPKKAVALCVAAALIVAMVPAYVFAAETTYDIWIGGVQVTSANKDDITTAITGAGGTADGTATYDPESETLTLNGFSYTGQGYVYDSPWCAAIFAKNDLTVKVVGSNTVTASVTGSYTAEALNVWGALTITGDSGSSLTLTGAGRDGVGCGGNLKIEIVTVNATGTSGLYSDEGITINNAIVNAVGNGDNAIYSTKAVSITNSSVTATAPSGDGIFIYNSYQNLTINNSMLTASVKSNGINVSMGSVHVTNSFIDITTTDGFAIESRSGGGQKAISPYFTDGSDNYVVYAGDDAASATKADVPTDDTYANKYVKIEPVKYDLWVGGVQVTSANLVIDSTDSTAITGGSATFDPAANTLTLNNFSYEGDGYMYGDSFGYGNYAAVYSGIDLTVKLVGTNNVTSSVAGYKIGVAFHVQGALTITDDTADETDSVLNLTGCNGNGLFSEGVLTIENVTVKATGVGGNGIYCENAVNINNAIVNIVSNNNQALYSYDAITINNSNVTVSSDEHLGVILLDSAVMNISNSTVELTAGIGKPAIYNGLVPDFGSAAVIVMAGDDAASATAADAKASETYKNRYIKIIPACTVTVNYGVDGVDNKEITVTKGDTISLENPVIDGYIFMGWYADADYTTAFDFDTPITAATTIYAKLADYEGDKKTLQDAIDALEADVTELNKLTESGGTFAQIDAKISAIESQVAALDALKNKYAEADTALKQELQQELQAADTAIISAIAALTGRVDTLEDEIDDLQTDVNGNAADIAENAAELAALNTSLTNLSNTLTNDYATKVELTNAINSAKETIEQAITALTGRVETLESELAAAKSDISTNTSKVAQLTAELAALNTSLTNLSNTLTNDYATKAELTSAINSAKDTINSAIDALTVRVQDLEADLAAAKSDISTNTSKVAELTTNLATLNASLTDLSNKLTNDYATKAELTSAINSAKDTINSAIDALTVRVQDLEAGLAAVNSKVDTNTSDVTALKSDVAALNTWKAQSQSTIAALETLTATQSADIARLKTAVQDLEAELAAARARIDDAEDRIAALEGKVSALEIAKQNLDAAVAALNAAINNKADTATLNQKVTDLIAAIAAAEDAVKTYADGKDTALQTQLTAAIATAKGEAITAAENLVNTAKAQLQAAIDNKADTAAVNAAIANLQNAITALQNAKDNYIAADAALKAELEEKIAKAKQEAIDAAKGYIPYIGTNGNWWIGDTDTGVDANGIKGDTGNGIASITTKKENGVTTVTITFTDPEKEPVVFTISDGETGATGADGVGVAKVEKTATNGNMDTYTITLTNGKTYTFTVTNGKDGADGKDGTDGKDGENGKDGLTPFIGENGNWWIGDTDTGVKAVAEQTAQKGTDTITVVSIVVASVALLSNLALVVWIVTKKKKVLV